MININELESRWLRYKIKSYIPHLIILTSLAIIAIVFMLFNTNSVNNNEVLVKEALPIIKPIEDVKKINSIKEKPIREKVIVKVEELQGNTLIAPVATAKINNHMLLKPSLDFMAKIKGSTLPYMELKEIQNKIAPIPPKKVLKKKSVSQIITAPIAEIQVIENISKKEPIQISRQNTHDDIEYVIKRFKKNNNPALSLFIAKKYYQLGEYHKSYNYSLMTNEISHDIEASWIIFAKSLVKLNEKDMAIKTLKKYIEQSSSNRATILLNDITSGKFK